MKSLIYKSLFAFAFSYFISSAHVNAQIPGTPFLALRELRNMFGGSATELAYAALRTQDNGVIAVGSTTSSNGDIIGQHGLQDFWIIKLDKRGNLQWQKTFGGSGDDQARSIASTADGGYIIAGNTSSNDGDVEINFGDFDYWVIKIDSVGNLLWKKSFGGSGNDMAYSVVVNNDATITVAGQSNSNNGQITGNNGGHDFWIVILDSNGNLISENSIGTPSTESALSITKLYNNSFFIAGYSYAANGNPDVYISKLNSAGATEWQRSYGGSNVDICTQIIPTNDGGAIATGYTNSTDGDVSFNHGSYDFWLIKLDSLGNIQWEKTFGGTADDRAYSLTQTSDSGFILGGSSTSADGDVLSNHSLMDFWILKCDNIGNIQWSKNVGGNGNDQCNSVFEDINGDYLVTGFSNSTTGEIARPVNGGTDFLILKLSASGQFKSFWSEGN